MAAILLIAASTDVNAQRRPLDCSVKVFSGVDYCSSDSSFIVTVECGPLAPVDSLLLYDLSIRYPASKITFKQVLYQNTLSENLETKGFGSKDTGEVRVYGFNVSRFLSGSKPLVALLFKHKAVCTDSISIGFTYLPEFNPEAKVYVRETISGRVPFTTAYDKFRSLTFQFSNDTLVSPVGTSKVRSALSWDFGGSARSSGISFQVVVTDGIDLDSVTSTGRTNVERESVGNGLTYRLSNRQIAAPLNADSVQLHFSLMDLPGKSGVVRISDVHWDTCSCISQSVADTLIVLRDVPNSVVSVSTGVHISSNGDVWEIENRTDFETVGEVVNTAGNVVWIGKIAANGLMTVNASTFPVGIYLIRFLSTKDPFVEILKVWK